MGKAGQGRGIEKIFIKILEMFMGALVRSALFRDKMVTMKFVE